MADDGESVLEIDRAADAVGEGLMDLFGVRLGEGELIPTNSPRRVDATGYGADEDDLRGTELEEAMENKMGGVGEVLHDDTLRPLQLLRTSDELGAEVEVAAPWYPEASDQYSTALLRQHACVGAGPQFHQSTS